MERRELLSWLSGFAASSLLAPLPGDERLRIATTLARTGSTGAFTAAQQTVVSTLADAILPRTDTPGALDVEVPAFIDHMVANWYSPEEADQLRRGLDAIESRSTSQFGRGVAALGGADLRSLLTALDTASGEPGTAEASFGRIKSLTVYGYFTSKTVQTEILKTPIIPGKFDGCIPVAR